MHVPWNALIGIAVIALLWFPEFTSARTTLGQAAMAVVFGVLLMLSVLLHELAHALIARSYGYRVDGITLWAMGGFTTYRTPRDHGPGREAVIAGAGPAATLAVAAVSWAAANAAGPGVAQDLLVALTSANLLVGVFNLLPGSPLDGGAIVKSAVWAVTGSQRRGQVVAGWSGRILAVVVMAAPFGLAVAIGSQPSFPLVAVGLVLGLLLWTGASASLRTADAGERLRSIPARSIARPMAVLPETATVADALALAQPENFVVIVGGARTMTGVLSPAAAQAVPPPKRASIPALSACATIDQPPAVAADADALEVLEACQAAGSRFVLLMDHSDAPVGLIDTDAVFVTEGP